jgi:methionyl-tRNA formyltransferase
MKDNKEILFLGRYKDQISIKILKILQKKFLNVNYIFSKNIMKNCQKNLKKKKFDCVLSYRNYIILSKKFLNTNKISINLHPGPPKYRGIGCLNFAIFNRERSYGVTCHFMKPKIDSGKIIISKNFNMPKNVTVNKLIRKTASEGF